MGGLLLGGVARTALLCVAGWLLLWAVLSLVLKQKQFGRAFDDVHTYLVLIAVSAVFVFPCLWLILASLSK